jgi:hypothetical protein
MNAKRNLRIATLGAIAAAALIHAGARLEWKSATGGEPVAFDARPLSLGDSIGNAVVDGVVNKPLPGVRLRLAQCGNPAFVFPLSILSVSEQQVVDRAYGLPAYRSTDVYRGHVRDGFSHISRITSYVASRAEALWSTEQIISEDRYVRAYVPSDCVVGRDAYVEWAAAVLKPGLNVARASEVSNAPAAQR